ncbi:MAG: hypothetical protein JO044_00895 [Mycobacteriaceae bacterium]|nr:hypothetical protein [Mycobacteriaceae bacterium]MBV9640847.1 hypothetical protein [Mycobacteriaceae bacterium]
MSREGVSGADPLTDAISRLLVLPLRELYAVLWRAGVVQVVDRPREYFDDTRVTVSSRGATAVAVVATATAAVPSA